MSKAVTRVLHSINSRVDELDAELDKAGVQRIASPRQVAEALGVSYHFLWGKIQQRELPSLRVGRAIRLRRADVSRWLAENEVSARDA